MFFSVYKHKGRFYSSAMIESSPESLAELLPNIFAASGQQQEDAHDTVLRGINDAGHDAINRMVSDALDLPEEIWDKLELLQGLVQKFKKAERLYTIRQREFQEFLRGLAATARQIDALAQDFSRPNRYKQYPEFCLMMACILPGSLRCSATLVPAMPGRPMRLKAIAGILSEENKVQEYQEYKDIVVYDAASEKYLVWEKNFGHFIGTDGKKIKAQFVHSTEPKPFYEKLNREYAALAERAADGTNQEIPPEHFRNLALYFALGLGGEGMMPDFEKAWRYAKIAAKRWDSAQPSPDRECLAFYRQYVDLAMNTERYGTWKIPEEDRTIIDRETSVFQGFLRDWASGKLPGIARQDVLALVGKVANVWGNQRLADLHENLSGKERVRDKAAEQAARAQLRRLLGRNSR